MDDQLHARAVDGLHALVSTLDVAVSDPATVGVNASDTTTAVSTVEIKVDDGSWRTVTDDDGDGVWETTVDTTKYDVGDHVIHIKVLDSAGNTKLREFSISIDNVL